MYLVYSALGICLQQISFGLSQIALVCDIQFVDSGVSSGPPYPWDSRLPPRCTFVVRSLLIISSRDCRETDSRDTSPRHACLGEVSRKIWLHDFAINNNGGSVPVIFISLIQNGQCRLVKR